MKIIIQLRLIFLEDGAASRWGFQITALDGENQRAGEFAVTDHEHTVLSDRQGNPQYLSHNSAGTYPGEREAVNWQFNWTAPGEDAGEITFYFTGNAADGRRSPGGDYIYSGSASISADEPPPFEFTVSLSEGWNFVSVPMMLDNAQMNDIFADLIQNGELVRVRNSEGLINDPRREIEEIEAWNELESYLIKIVDDADLTFIGARHEEEPVYELTQGWQWISYPHLNPAHPLENFSVVADRLDIVKNGEGRFYAPEYEVSTLPMIEPGNGVMVKASDNVELNWLEWDGDPEEPEEIPVPERFAPYFNTGRNMSVIIAETMGFEIAEGDEFTVMATRDEEPYYYGASKATGQIVPLTVWGDDLTTDILDGFEEGEALSFIWYSSTDQSTYTLEASSLAENVEAVYETDAVLPVRLTKEESIRLDPSSPADYTLTSVYPNPFNSTVNFSFNLKARERVRFSIHNLDGGMVYEAGESVFSPGGHALTWNADNFTSGIYFVRFEIKGSIETKKLVLMK